MALNRASSLLSEAGGAGGAEDPPPQPASESATTAAPERVRNSRRFIFFMGVLLSIQYIIDYGSGLAGSPCIPAPLQIGAKFTITATV